MWKSVVAVASVFSAFAAAQLPIPTKPPGFTLGEGSAGAVVQLESYIDLLCPDSKSAYAGLKELAAYYKPEEVRVRFVPFPLPYHQHAFATAEAAFTITAALGDSHFIPWLETIYANQDQFWNKATKDLTPIQVTDKLKQLAQLTFPTLTDEQWNEGMTGYGGTDADDQTRVAWKYTCSRGVSGTPMYRLNGVPFDADATWSFKEWKDVIDPLVQANVEVTLDDVVQNNVIQLGGALPRPDRQVVQLSSARGLAAAAVCESVTDGVRPCEFVPGQAMCCRSNEACILRSGCVLLD